ncbi:LuxR C-terminal-related transcriptional regulator [Methylobacterium soli]|jgi:DNA-binding NarL/FixJ family response regulator|uniref:Response regulator transcription factor n=1 Tax=Methylobacterium soli TaxID=553447 RepID=A0A6L3SWN8_9HYPH|nr:response regulator transcription factor [Methylobacterium soli]KAB1078318.1 response regulator transcription factor [Methylobacterium soli]GJE42008.1 Nitrate/nitrite response regulator protein NarL [Methylobacterium soli]
MTHQDTIALIADDHELFRAGLSALLKRDCGFASVIEAASLDAAMQILGETPAITFASFDLAMPGVGSALSLRSVREVFPHVRVAVVSGSGDRDDIFLALQAGLHGYVPKTLGIPDITRAFQKILRGEIFVPPLVAELPAQAEPPACTEFARMPEPGVKLTPRQSDVLRLIRCGKSNKEIARSLNLTESTVKVHAVALYRALGVHNRYGAARVERD